ncbi:MAG: hypothetical protein LHV68_05355 [Elusimicrobia bacterium]|nr:hypothetical protein [Candidatus Liberimonas magnetica]
MKKKEQVKDMTVTKSFFYRANDGRVAELIYDPCGEKQKNWAVYVNDGISICETLNVDGVLVHPGLEDDMSIFESGTVLFSSGIEDYESDGALLDEAINFIRDYVTVSPGFTFLSALYAFYSYIFDKFSVLPYLRVIGEYGSGKSRFLQTVGSICYRGMFTGGATTVSPIFRIINQVRGTFVLDEADFKNSGARADITKILNCGYMEGIPVLRTEKGKPRAFQVYCPKILATRGEFQDQALESRCITEEMVLQPQSHVPDILTNDFKIRAQSLRNKFMKWRLVNYGKAIVNDNIVFPQGIEPRLKQILRPLFSVFEDPKIRKVIIDFAMQYDKKIVESHKSSVEYSVLEAIEYLRDMKVIPISEIAKRVSEKEEDKKLTPKKVGDIIRRRLLMPTERKSHGYVMNYDESKLKMLNRRYGVVNGERMNVINL